MTKSEIFFARKIPSIICLFLSLGQLASKADVVPWTNAINTNFIVTVTNVAYGASTAAVDNTTAIQSAINAAAMGGTTNGLTGGVVRIPAGTFLSGPLVLSNYVNLQLDAGAILQALPYLNYPGAPYTITAQPFLNADGRHDVSITGAGAIDGQGQPWWDFFILGRPILASFQPASRVLLQGVIFSNSPSQNIQFKGSGGNVIVDGISVFAPSSHLPIGSSHNTDAIDFAETNALIQNCLFDTGDDNLAFGNSSGVTRDVLVTNCVCGAGHGISIGSNTAGGVSNILIIDCSFNGTDHPIRLKSDNNLHGTSKGGMVQNISFLNISITNANYAAILLYSYYNANSGTPVNVSPGGAAAAVVDPVGTFTPIWRNITISNLTATVGNDAAIGIAGIIWGRTELPVTNVVLNRVNITAAKSFDIYNAQQIKFIDSTITATNSGQQTFTVWNANLIVTNSVLATNHVSITGLAGNTNDSLALYNAPADMTSSDAFGCNPITLGNSVLTNTGSFIFDSADVVNFLPGTNDCTLAVSGNLTLGGTNNIFAGAGFTNGSYTLMTYNGTLAGSLPALGATPYGFNCILNTNIAGLVQLVVSNAGLIPPLPPASLTATGGNAVVTLTWPPVTTATNYNIKRAYVTGGPYAVIGGSTGTNYSDVQVTNGSPYFYVVSGVNGAGEGGNSPEASAAPAAPLTNTFTENFSASTLNSTPTAPTTLATSYEIISSKAWSPAPSISPGHLKFGIGSTSGGTIEAQALFTNSPVLLTNVGDTISMTVTFANTAGLLTGAGFLGFGLYASGQNFPVSGGMTGTATNGITSNVNGNAQRWAGYVGQLAFTGGNSRIMTRAPQTGPGNNNQDCVTSGSSSQSYANPSASTVGTASSTPSLTLIAGNSYTEVLTITLLATGTLAITNYFYSGTNTSGTLLSQFGGVASSTTFITNGFDALAIGWRETGSQATTIDINRIVITAAIASPTLPLPSAPTNFSALATNLAVKLKWNASADALSYFIKRGTVNGGPYPTALNTTQTNYTDLNVTNGATYFYVVTATNAVGESTNSVQVSATPLPSNQPTNLVSSFNGTQLILSWPSTHLGWQLQIQTNDLGNGLSTNWTTVPNSTASNSIALPVSTQNGNVFLRLVYP
jgi:polygalacturonase